MDDRLILLIVVLACAVLCVVRDQSYRREVTNAQS